MRLPTPLKLERLLFLVILIPIIAVVLFVARYGYTVPWVDEYIRMVPLVLAQQEGTLSLGDLFVQIGDHRIPIPYGISVLLSAVSGGDMRLELAFNLVLALGCFAFAVDMYRLKAKGRTELLVFASIAAFLIFSIGQRQNWVWGNQKCIFLMMVGTYASAWALAKFPGRPRAFWICVAGTLVASWSFLGGNVLWGVIPIALWLHGFRKWSTYATWLVIAAISLSIYLSGYERDVTYRPFTGIETFAQAFAYILLFLGNGLSSETIYFLHETGTEIVYVLNPLIMGLLGCVALGLNLTFARNMRRVSLFHLSPWLLLLGFTLANGLLLAIGRSDLLRAMTAHYITLAIPFWLTLGALMVANIHYVFQQGRSAGSRRRTFALVNLLLALLFAGGFLANTAHAWALRETYNTLMEQCFLTRLDADDRCRTPHFFFHDWLHADEVIVMLDRLQQEQMFLFRQVNTPLDASSGFTNEASNGAYLAVTLKAGTCYSGH